MKAVRPLTVTLQRRSDLWAVCALLALSALYWAPWVARGNVPVPGDQQTWMLPWVAESFPEPKPAGWDAFWWDGVAQFYPWRVQLHRWLSRGAWPLWTDSQFCGYPFVGNAQSALFYPPNWLYAVAHPRLGFPLLSGAHFALAALLTFAFCRRIGVGVAGAMLAGVAFAWGGFMMGMTPLPTLMNSAAWLPGCLLGVEMVVRRRGPGSVAVLAVCIGMTLLAGHLQVAAYVLLATVLYAAARVGHAAAGRRPTGAAHLAAAAVLGLMLGAAQLAPSVELGGLSPRGAGAPSREALEAFHRPRALQPGELPTLIFPDALGNPAQESYRGMSVAPGAAYGERSGYVGALTLALALAGLLAGRSWWRWGFGLAALLSLWAAMGGIPATAIYFGVPKVGLTGGFTRLLCLYTFFAAVLGGTGLDALARRSAAVPAGWMRRAVLLLGPVAVIAVSADLLTWGWRTLPSAPAERLYAQTALTRHLEAHARPGERMLAVTPREEWSMHRRPAALLPPNAATAYDGPGSVQGYDSLFPRTYDRLAVAVEQGPRSPAANGNMVLLENTASPLLDLAGVRWILTRAARDREEAEGTVLNSVRVTENERAFPRAFLADAETALSPDALEALAERGAPPGAEMRLRGSNTLQVDVPARDASAALVVTQTLYPGWRAWVDGREAQVHPVGGVFQAVELPAGGPAQVTLAYVPGSVTVGLFLFLVAAGILAGLLAGLRVSANPRGIIPAGGPGRRQGPSVQ